MPSLSEIADMRVRKKRAGIITIKILNPLFIIGEILILLLLLGICVFYILAMLFWGQKGSLYSTLAMGLVIPSFLRAMYELSSEVSKKPIDQKIVNNIYNIGVVILAVVAFLSYLSHIPTGELNVLDDSLLSTIALFMFTDEYRRHIKAKIVREQIDI